jgi:hypothetical protein
MTKRYGWIPWWGAGKRPIAEDGCRLCKMCPSRVDFAGGRREYCSAACAEDYRIRTNGNFARKAVYKRDHGVCALCRTECPREPPNRRGRPGKRIWHMDHILPVIEGGGGCGLDNLRTLCVPCHNIETAALARRRAAARRAAESTPEIEMATLAGGHCFCYRYIHRGHAVASPYPPPGIAAPWPYSLGAARRRV